MNKIKILSSFVAGTVLLLNGCGSDSSTSTVGSAPVDTGTAFYVDAAIEGVTVECGATTSVTASNGAFTYEAGGECQFKVGNVLLRTESGLTENKIIFEDNVRTAQFLQTLDIDGNPDNGITISSYTSTVLADMGITAVPQYDVILAEVVEAMEVANTEYDGRFVTSAEAQAHMEISYEAYFGEPWQPDVPNDPGVPTVPDAPSVPNDPSVPTVPDVPIVPHL
jgi:hypothetical protein